MGERENKKNSRGFDINDFYGQVNFEFETIVPQTEKLVVSSMYKTVSIKDRVYLDVGIRFRYAGEEKYRLVRTSLNEELSQKLDRQNSHITKKNEKLFVDTKLITFAKVLSDILSRVNVEEIGVVENEDNREVVAQFQLKRPSITLLLPKEEADQFRAYKKWEADHFSFLSNAVRDGRISVENRTNSEYHSINAFLLRCADEKISLQKAQDICKSGILLRYSTLLTVEKVRLFHESGEIDGACVVFEPGYDWIKTELGNVAVKSKEDAAFIDDIYGGVHFSVSEEEDIVEPINVYAVVETFFHNDRSYLDVGMRIQYGGEQVKRIVRLKPGSNITKWRGYDDIGLAQIIYDVLNNSSIVFGKIIDSHRGNENIATRKKRPIFCVYFPSTVVDMLKERHYKSGYHSFDYDGYVVPLPFMNTLGIVSWIKLSPLSDEDSEELMSFLRTCREKPILIQKSQEICQQGIQVIRNKTYSFVEIKSACIQDEIPKCQIEFNPGFEYLRDELDGPPAEIETVANNENDLDQDRIEDPESSTEDPYRADSGDEELSEETISLFWADADYY